MSIESGEWGGPVTLQCNTCATFIDFSSFKKAVAFKAKQKLIQNGWRSYNTGGVWQDSCPDCVKKFAKGESKDE